MVEYWLGINFLRSCICTLGMLVYLVHPVENSGKLTCIAKTKMLVYFAWKCVILLPWSSRYLN